MPINNTMYQSTFGKPIAINVSYKIYEDGTREIDPTVTVNSGQAVVIAESGQLVPVTTNVKPYGLIKNNKNAYIDETHSIHYSGSGKGSVVVKGVATLSKIAFVASDGSEVPFIPFDTTVAWKPMDPVYVNLTTGLLTNQVAADVNDATYVGYVLKYTADASFPVLEILVDC